MNTGDQFQDIQIFGEQNRYRPIGKCNYSFKFVLGGDGEDPDTSAEKTLGNISRSYEDAAQAFSEVDISPEMREYVNKVWDQYDVTKDGELELYEAKKLLNDIVSQVEGEEVQLSEEELIQTFDLFDDNKDGVIDKMEFY